MTGADESSASVSGELPAPQCVTGIARTVDKASPVPYYYQFRQLLGRAVADGVLAAGEQIPTEASLCERHGVSRTVVRQASSDLERTGHVTHLKGKGTFVAEGEGVAYMPYSISAPILDLDMSDRSLFETYEREPGLKLDRRTRTIEARAARSRRVSG